MDYATIIAAVAAVAAVVSAVVSFISLIFTKRGNRQKIEASLVWSSRIEWIQNVRRVTADFIASCYMYMQSEKNDQDMLDKNIALVEKNKVLLTLYFGPDTVRPGKKMAKDIWDKTTNAGKNEDIVNFINKIYKQIKTYFTHKYEYETCCDALRHCDRCKHGECTKCESNEYHDVYTREECDKKITRLKKSRNEAKKEIDSLQKNIELLSEAMRIYLKEEWRLTKDWSK